MKIKKEKEEGRDVVGEEQRKTKVAKKKRKKCRKK